MWRRIYLILLAVRLYFAFSPSYLHPDEHFQGPEVIAGSIFSYPIHKTWEFSTDKPVRSVFPLWIVYGLPMYTLQCLWDGVGKADVPPMAVYRTLRAMMFVLTFVFQDWAIQELVEKRKQRQFAIILISSSYVTWTYQSHTFSNSVETLLVLWSLVVISRFARESSPSLLAPVVLGFLTVVGLFNRITFGAFMVVPYALLFLTFLKRPLALIGFSMAVAFTALVAVLVDTSFYRPESSTSLLQLIRHPVITPYNLLEYNLSHSNLAKHGIHPYYRHFLGNLPQLLGPAVFLLFQTFAARWTKVADRVLRRSRPSSPSSSNDSSCTSREGKTRSLSQTTASFFSSSLLMVSGLTGCVLLSALPHQEARFLLPVVPLFLASVRPPRTIKARRMWMLVWIVFNTILGLIMGVYHQGGVVPVQGWLGERFGRSSSISFDHSPSSSQLRLNASEVFWWKTYSPPLWLMNGANDHVKTVDLMGTSPEAVVERISAAALGLGCSDVDKHQLPLTDADVNADAILLVAPRASEIEVVLRDVAGPANFSSSNDKTTAGETAEGAGRTANSAPPLILHHEHFVPHHVGLDDLDFGSDGVFGTVAKLVQKRGLDVWSIRRRPGRCGGDGSGGAASASSEALSPRPGVSVDTPTP